jgi:hypothetical protein
MKQQLVVTHRYTVLQEKEITWQTLNTPTAKHVMFLRKQTLTEGAFVAQMSSNAGISVWGIVWVMTHCCFMSDTDLRVHPRNYTAVTRKLDRRILILWNPVINTCTTRFNTKISQFCPLFKSSV